MFLESLIFKLLPPELATLAPDEQLVPEVGRVQTRTDISLLQKPWHFQYLLGSHFFRHLLATVNKIF